MKIYNKIYNTNPIILHRPGKNWHDESCDCSYNCRFWKNINYIFFNKKYNYENKHATFITWNNTNEKKILEKCFKHLKIDYVCLGREISIWDNTLKMLTLYEHINNIKTKYIFGLDCFDVLFLGNVEYAIEVFEKLNCEMLFNSSPKKFPQYSDATIEEKIAPKNAKLIYLNAGCWIAKTDFLKKIIVDIKNLIIKNPKEKSEQYFMRKIFNKNSNYIKIDYYMKIFQSGIFNQIKYSEKKFL